MKKYYWKIGRSSFRYEGVHGLYLGMLPVPDESGYQRAAIVEARVRRRPWETYEKAARRTKYELIQVMRLIASSARKWKRTQAQLNKIVNGR